MDTAVTGATATAGDQLITPVLCVVIHTISPLMMTPVFVASAVLFVTAQPVTDGDGLVATSVATVVVELPMEHPVAGVGMEVGGDLNRLQPADDDLEDPLHDGVRCFSHA